MALVEQPLKKRKLYDPVLESESLKHIPVSPLSQEEIMRKQRNKEEIRSLYDCYRRIRFCVSHKDANLMTDFEQAYLSLITASRGCTSAQRIIAELIPRYASFCPTALEAAAKVAINMYNWSLAVILRGEDSDLVAFQTAKTCIFGLVDICCAASLEAPTSSVIRGICSAVFLNALTFFVSSFEGKDIYQLGEDIVKVQHRSEYFSELKQKVADEDESILCRLFKFRALCLIRIFFCYPKNLLAACFELFKSNGDVGAIEGGSYFLRQVTGQIDAADVTHPLEKICEKARSCSGSIGTSAEGNVGTCEGTPVSDGNQISDEASLISKNCLLGMALGRDPSLRDWIFSKYNNISNSVGSNVASEILSALEGIIGTSQEWVRELGPQEDGDEDNSDPSQYLNRKYTMPRISNERESSAEQSGRNLKVHDASTVGSFKDERDPADRVSGQPKKCCNSEVLVEPDVQSVNDSSHYKCESSRSMNDPETLAQSDSCHARLSMQKKLLKNQLLSPVNRKPLDLKNDSLGGGNHLGPLENQLSQSASCLSAMRSSSGCATSTSQSPDQPSAVRYQSSTSSHIAWYFDGDPAAMDVISASTQLWLGSLGPNATESLVRYQFEMFGPIERFLFFPIKGFALVEYKSIFDAIKAREYSRGSSPWGAPLRIKFLDIGLGSRGSINGVAVGASCHVYIGKVSSQWAKDEIMHEFVRVGFRFPRRVTDLTSETALLMEFETAEEAAVVMVHLRQHRKESGYHVQTNKSLSLNASGKDFAGQHINGSRCFPTPNHVEFRCNNLGSMPNNMVGSPHYSTVLDSPIDHYNTRLSQLSSFLSSLSSKYNISQSPNAFGGHRSRNYHETSIRDEDRLSSSTLCISIPDTSSSFLTDDELMSVCHLAAGNAGSVVRLQRTSMQMSSCWFVKFYSVDAAVTALKNLQSCPVSFFQIEFSQPGNHNCTPFISRSESSAHDLVSPIINSESHGTTTQSVHAVRSNWNGSGYTEMPDGGSRKAENMAVDLSHPVLEAHAGSHANDQLWMYKKPETQPQFSTPGSMSCVPRVTQGPTVMPTQQQQVQESSFMHPVYRVPNNSWDPHGASHPLPLNHISPGIMPNNNLHVNVGAPPFLPASVTPVAQLPRVSMQHFDQTISLAVVPPSSPPPPPPDVPPPSPPPPPLPVSQPPHVPPPPSSPPPQPAVQLSNLENCGQRLQYQWQGVLCKSGIHYCTIYALREKLDACKYSNPMPEPAEWPTRLDVTKRTDFQHVKLTFASTPPHKREVCRLLPSTSNQKGYQDFVSYLKHRECAGVIKIPAGKSMWARLLFILPCTLDICSMLAMAPYPSECLLALVLPKETSSEWL